MTKPSLVAKHPHIGLHAALAVEQGGVGAGSGLECLDVVGELALQVLASLGSGDGDHAPPLAGQHAGRLSQYPILGIELNRGRGIHPTILAVALSAIF